MIAKKLLRQLFSIFGINVSKNSPELIRNRNKNIDIDFDFVLADYLLGRGKKRGVKIIQIGAYDGCTSDELYPYIKNFEWNGLLVEPQKKYFKRLKKTYEGESGINFLQAAVAHNRGRKTLYTIKNPESEGMPPIAPRIASFDKKTILSHKDKIPNIESKIKETKVKSLPLMDMIEEYSIKDVEILQIDVEGFDSEVIKMIDFSKIYPSIVRFEHKHLSRKEHSSAIKKLLKNGYDVAEEPGNTIAYNRNIKINTHK